MIRRGRPRHPDILTPREWQVLELVRQGLTNPEIAKRMGISLDGAKYHVSEIIAKLGVADRKEAAAWRAPKEVARRFRMAAILGASPPKITAAAAGRLALGAATLAVAVALGVLAWGLLSVEKGPVDLDLRPGVFVVDTEGTRLTRITDSIVVCETQCGEYYPLVAWSPDGRQLLINDSGGSADSLLVGDPDVGSVRKLGIRAWSSSWLANGQIAAYAPLDAGIPRREGLLSIDPATGSASEVAPGALSPPVLSPDGARYLVVEREPQFRLELVERSSGQRRELFRGEPLFVSWSPDGSAIAFNVVNDLRSGVAEPLDLVVLGLDGSQSRWQEAGQVPAWSPDNSLIATVQYRYPEGREESWIVLLKPSGGSTPRVLTRGSQPSFSPDGRSIAFVREGEVWRIDVDGKNERKLVASALPMVTEVRWSLDGSRLALVATAGGGRLYAIGADGRGERYLAPGTGPKASPDGRRIAFFFRSGIYVMDLKDGGIVKAGRTQLSDVIPPCLSGERFTWSPDGRLLAFWSDDPGAPGVYVWEGKSVRRVGRGYGPSWMAGGKLGFTATNQLACSVRLVSAAGADETLWRDKARGADWSPDGRYAVYLDAPTPGPLPSDLIITSADGQTELRRLSGGTHFAWSPRGSRFAYVRRPELAPLSAPGVTPPIAPAVVPPDVPWTLVVGVPDPPPDFELLSGIGLDFAWSPDGRQIAYAVRQDWSGEPQIYIVSLDDPANRRLLTSGSSPSWSADGKRIFFQR